MLPRGLTAVAGRLTRLVPEPLLARILPGRLRYDPASLAVAVPPETPIRLFVGPVNFAGQGWQWARAAERLPGVGAVSMAYRIGTEFGYPVDVEVPASAYVFSKSWQRAQREAVTGGFSHVIVEAERHLFGRVYDQTVEQQVRELLASDVRVAMLSHGSDLRLPSRHAATHPDSPFQPDWDQTAVFERQAADNLALLERLGLPVFVSTLGLLSDMPSADWLPVVIDVEAWSGGEPPMLRARPVVAHAPSNGRIKGSDLIDPALSRLHGEGLIEYRRVTGVPAAEMPELYRSADIVLDQFRLGDYGVAACEALAAGRVVVGHVADPVRSAVSARTGLELPVVESAGADVERVLRRLVADPDGARAVAARGPAFVREVHDGRFSADAMSRFLGTVRDDDG
ncbi:hypothetical protein MUN74_02635 [Agromyces endophyticus]|uniref:glycosyltransferase family protein n=1 Tax=Agromyces sp. H17E-10 TaxID=2932244 RepID=UPI001FD4B585|nr:hypothetical protein [Agromyces sp. H17E-10]UOQ89835.1 hypothetical protein MUN74_02635 [Agromyces sp. H17E-10]